MDAQRLKDFIKRDFIYIILLLFALFACLYTMYQVTEVQVECNNRWLEQLNQSECYRDCQYIYNYYPGDLYANQT